MSDRAPAWRVRIRAAVMRRPKTFALLTVVLVACSAAVPTAVSPSPLASLITLAPTPSPTPTPRPLVKARSVSVAGDAIVATGDFRGSGDTQVATIDDPTGELAVRITLRSTLSDAAAPAVWFQTDRNFLALARAKVAVADVDFDGKDDLVAFYNGGENTSKIFVFRSTGTGFTFGGTWWSGPLTWSRARDVVAGKFSASGHDTVLVAYQDDNFRIRLIAFDSNGKAFNDPTRAYDSGVGQYDLAKARLAVGHFTRAGGLDQVVILAQSGTKASARILDPTANGLALGIDLVTDTDYDVTHAALGAADVLGTGHDELIALYTDAQGGAKTHVFDLSSAPVKFLTPLQGWGGWGTLPAGAVCGGPGALVIGDWDRDGRPDAAALAPAALDSPIRAQLLTNTGSSFTTKAASDATLRCPVWPLTGMPLGFGDATQRPVYVKTDNNPSARPHYGISKADIVYEWLVEGLTTRLAAVYQSQHPDVIGSVRSVRMTDRHVLPSLDAVLVYSGGGPEELMAINYDASVAHRYVDLSPNYGWGYRVPFREGPYNYFTSWANVRSAIAAAPDGEQPATVAPWRFLPTATGDPQQGGFATGAPATSITIPYRALFGVQYTYDAGSRSYARYDNGVREVDGANSQAIAAKNVVVIQTEVNFTTAFGLDPAGNPKLEEILTGTGKAVVFRDGLRVDATWTRNDVVDSFILKDSKGAVIALEPGQTWIHVVPSEWTISSQ